MKKNREGGFTLLELLIVISIIAILSVALIFVINPAETLKKSRDAQRISDLNTMKTALGLYTTSTTTPYLGIGNTYAASSGCFATAASSTPIATTKIFYSLPGGTGTIAATNLDGIVGTAIASTTSATTYTLTDGTGWLPVNFDSLIGGSPISNLPIDPVNTLASGEGGSGQSVTASSTMYRYACSISPLVYEINVPLESDTYTTGADNKLTKDGGNNPYFYEVGTGLKILGPYNNY